MSRAAPRKRSAFFYNKIQHMKIQAKQIIALSVILVIIDQISKILVKTTMTLDESIHIFGNWFQIRFIENPGAAYGMELGGDYGKLILSLFRVVAIIFISIYISRLLKRRAPTGVIIGFTLIMVGALGNVIDSAFYGMIFSESTFNTVATFTSDGYGTFLHGNVVDMLYFPIIDISRMPDWIPIWGGERFIFFSPIFNIADTYISVALIYLIIFQRKFFK